MNTNANPVAEQATKTPRAVKLSTMLGWIGACKPAIEYMKQQQRKGFTPREIWESCEHPDWILWLTGETATLTPRQYALIAITLAKSAMVDIPECEHERVSVAVLEKWYEGVAPTEDVYTYSYKLRQEFDAWSRPSYFAASLITHIGTEINAKTLSNLAAITDSVATEAEVIRTIPWREVRIEQAALVRSMVSFEAMAEALRREYLAKKKIGR